MNNKYVFKKKTPSYLYCGQADDKFCCTHDKVESKFCVNKTAHYTMI